MYSVSFHGCVFCNQLQDSKMPLDQPLRKKATLLVKLKLATHSR